MRIAGDNVSAPDAMADAARSAERRTLGVACGAHMLHDGYTDLIYVLLPIWQAEFGLVYAEIGLLRGLYAGTMAVFQIPSGLLAEKLGAAHVILPNLADFRPQMVRRPGKKREGEGGGHGIQSHKKI